MSINENDSYDKVKSDADDDLLIALRHLEFTKGSCVGQFLLFHNFFFFFFGAQFEPIVCRVRA